MSNRREDDSEDINVEDLRKSPSAWAKYGWKGGIISIILAGAPFLINEWDKYQEIKRNLVVENMMLKMETRLSKTMEDKIEKKILPHLSRIKQMHLESRAFASQNHMKELVSAESWNVLIRHRVRSQSLDKVKEIKEVWLRANRKTEEGKKRLWTKVKNILYRNTSIYVNEFRDYGHPVMGDIGTYVAKTFPMYKDKSREYRPEYSFLEVVYKITIDTPTQDVDVMGDDLTEYMKAIQDEYFTDHYKIIYKLEKSIRSE